MEIVGVAVQRIDDAEEIAAVVADGQIGGPAMGAAEGRAGDEQELLRPRLADRGDGDVLDPGPLRAVNVVGLVHQREDQLGAVAIVLGEAAPDIGERFGRKLFRTELLLGVVTVIVQVDDGDEPGLVDPAHRLVEIGQLHDVEPAVELRLDALPAEGQADGAGAELAEPLDRLFARIGVVGIDLAGRVAEFGARQVDAAQAGLRPCRQGGEQRQGEDGRPHGATILTSASSSRRPAARWVKLWSASASMVSEAFG